MWNLKSVNEKYETYGGEVVESLSKDKVYDIDFESKLEAITYVANMFHISPWDEDFNIDYLGNLVKIRIFRYHTIDGTGYYIFHITKK